MGGPTPIPDRVFTYKVPKFEMESESAKKEMSGAMIFTFIDAKQVCSWNITGHQTLVSNIVSLLNSEKALCDIAVCLYR